MAKRQTEFWKDMKEEEESRIERRGMGEEGSLVCLCFDK